MTHAHVVVPYASNNSSVRTRALHWIELVHRGMVYIVRGDWNVEFLREAEVFPDGAHDDLIDGVSGAHIMLKSAKKIIVA